jgi:hypothetical protein
VLTNAEALGLDRHVLGVEVRRTRRDVYAEFADVVERLLAVEAVLVAARELAVVVQLDGAQRVVLREFVAKATVTVWDR